MFFLLRVFAVVAVIFHFSPVHEAAAPAERALDMAALEKQVLAALDDPRYQNWSAVPRHARDRLAIEIAQQLADAALAPSRSP
ncbi:MAG: hypothetical protein EA385_14830 [Salinarimonadaceae bacterium]|nr:MAG: hypothetical protein EA385_14830 [Salinarimonadaceae bacterium]